MSDFKSKFVKYFKGAGAGSLLISIIVHLFIIGGATVYVVSSVQEQRKPPAFQGGPASPVSNQRQQVEHRVQMSRQQQNLSAVSQRLTVDSPNAAVSLPELPDMGSGSVPNIGGGGLGEGAGAGVGSGPGSIRAPIMPAFGFKEAQPGGMLVGNFYDFKQLRGPKPNPDYVPAVAEGKGLDGAAARLAVKEVLNFVEKKFSRPSLLKFFVAPNPLFTTQVYIPTMDADAAPAAFNVEKVAKGKAWMVLYRGKVSPPVSGTYRFVGGSDDIIIVRMDGRIVLDGGIGNITKFVSDKPRYKYTFKGNGVFREGVMVGKSMQLQAGQYYDIAIAISEAPGGQFSAFLFFEQEGVKYKTTPEGSPILPIFRVAPSQTAQSDAAPPFMPDGPIWRAQPPPKD